MTTYTQAQNEMIQEIASLAKLKGVKIEKKEDLDNLMQDWILNNFSANYFKNEDFKNNADRELKKILNLK